MNLKYAYTVSTQPSCLSVLSPVLALVHNPPRTARSRRSRVQLQRAAAAPHAGIHRRHPHIVSIFLTCSGVSTAPLCFSWL